MLGEVETVKKIKEFSYRVGRGVINLNIKITEYEDFPWGCVECGEKKIWVRFWGPVNQENCRLRWPFAFKCKAFK